MSLGFLCFASRRALKKLSERMAKRARQSTVGKEGTCVSSVGALPGSMDSYGLHGCEIMFQCPRPRSSQTYPLKNMEIGDQPCTSEKLASGFPVSSGSCRSAEGSGGWATTVGRQSCRFSKNDLETTGVAEDAVWTRGESHKIIQTSIKLSRHPSS